MATRKAAAPAPQMEKGVIYARYSSSGQRDESIEGQLRDCREYASRLGIAIVGEYCDKALTGTVDKRPEFQRMIKDSSKGQFTVAICWKNDRFARNRYDAATYKRKLKLNGVRVIYAKETIPEGPEGIVMEGLMESMAEYYSANLSQNVKRGNLDSAMKRQTLGQSVLGLRAGPDKRWEIDPNTAPLIRRIFEEYGQGIPAKEIIDRLNSEGFRTVRGNLFNKNSIRRIIENEKYCGVYTYLDVIRDENGIPPIVSRELWERCIKMADTRHRAPNSKPASGGFLLTGKLFCGECGEPMTGDGGTSRSGQVYSYYICNGKRKHKCTKLRIKKDWIEDLIIDELVKLVNDDAMVNELAERVVEWERKQQRDNSLVESMEKELRRTEAAIKNNMSLIDSGFVTDSIKTHMVELESQRVSLEAGIAKEKLVSNSAIVEKDQIMWFLEKFRSGDTGNLSWKLSIVETLLKAAYVFDDGKLLIHLNFSGTNNKFSLKTAINTVDAGELMCSTFAPSGAPIGANLNTEVYFLAGAFVLLVKAQK